MPYRTPEEQAAIDARKYRAWNELKAGATQAGREFLTGLRAGARTSVPQWDFRSPAAEFMPERTRQVIQDFRSTLPGPEAGKPTFADRRPAMALAFNPRMGAADPVLNQFPLTSGLGVPGYSDRALALMGGAGPYPEVAEPTQQDTIEGALIDEPPRRGQPKRKPNKPAAPPAVTPNAPPLLGGAIYGVERTPDTVSWRQGMTGRGSITSETNPEGLARMEQGLRENRYGITPEAVERNRAADERQLAETLARNADYRDQTNALSNAERAAWNQARVSDWLADQQATRIALADPKRAAAMAQASGAGVQALGGIGQEGVRGISGLAMQQLENAGQYGTQYLRNQGGMGIQGLQNQGALDVERLRNEGVLGRERVLDAREAAKLQQEREDKMAERMGLTQFDPQTGMPIGQVPTNKYVYGQPGQEPPQRPSQQFVPGQIYIDGQGRRARYKQDGTWEILK